MMWILRIVLFPVFLIVMFIQFLLKLATQVSTFVLGLVMLFVILCGALSVVQRQWISTVIIIGMGFLIFAAMFLVTWFELMLSEFVEYVTSIIYE